MSKEINIGPELITKMLNEGHSVEMEMTDDGLVFVFKPRERNPIEEMVNPAYYPELSEPKKPLNSDVADTDSREKVKPRTTETRSMIQSEINLIESLMSKNEVKSARTEYDNRRARQKRARLVKLYEKLDKL